MKDSQIKKLNRAQLIDIIYQLQLKQEELMAENSKLSETLNDKRIRIEKMGSVADAAFEIHNVMKAVQAAADHYVEETIVRANAERNQILKNATQEANTIISNAKEEARNIIKNVRNSNYYNTNE